MQFRRPADSIVSQNEKNRSTYNDNKATEDQGGVAVNVWHESWLYAPMLTFPRHHLSTYLRSSLFGHSLSLVRWRTLSEMICEIPLSAQQPSDNCWKRISSLPISTFSALGVSHVMRCIIRYLLTYLLTYLFIYLFTISGRVDKARRAVTFLNLLLHRRIFYRLTAFLCLMLFSIYRAIFDSFHQRKLNCWQRLRIWDSFAIFTCVSYAEARNRYRLDVRPSVRLSVWHTLALYQNGWIYCEAFFTTR